MIAADTNLLVRHIVEDDAQQAAEARRAFSAGPVYLSNVVLAEAQKLQRRSCRE